MRAADEAEGSSVTHTYHEHLPGFDPRNIMHDGCPECEERAKDPATGIMKLDVQYVITLWARMMNLKWGGGYRMSVDWVVSECDHRLMTYMYRMAMFQERYCNIHPTSTLELMYKAHEEACKW